MRLLEGCSTLYTGSAFRVSVIGAKLVCLSITSKQARVALECCHAVLGVEMEVSPYIHGLPESIILDRGVQFAAGMMKELNNLLGIQTKLSTAYHPQTDGQTERVNQELEQYLRVFIDHRQEQWPDWLGTAKFAYNNKIHVTTKISPFRINYG